MIDWVGQEPTGTLIWVKLLVSSGSSGRSSTARMEADPLSWAPQGELGALQRISEIGGRSQPCACGGQY
jgi:hypothetical protein